MRYILFFTFSVFLFSCNNNNGPKVVAPPANLQNMTVIELPGSAIQKAFRYDPSGNVMEEGDLLDGKKTGTWVVYHPGNKNMVKTILNYANGLRNGIYMDLNDRSQLKEVGYFMNDLKDGKWTKWNYSRRETEQEFKAGKKHGIHRTFYKNGKDGIVQEEVEFKNGVQDGIYKWYLEDGTVSMDYVYKDGKKVE